MIAESMEITEEIQEECGIFGLHHSPKAASFTYFGLHALQHRGQEAAGIAVSDGQKVSCIKNRGLVAEVFDQKTVRSMDGIHSVGHVRYATAGGDSIENVQPIMVRSHYGHFAVVHNGQIVNAELLKRRLEEEGSIFQSSSDSEIVAHLIQRAKGTFSEKIIQAVSQLEGAFSILIMTKSTMYAVRDKNGIRPLSMASIGEEGYCFSSESCAFDTVNAQFIRDILPGEVLKVGKGEIKSMFYAEKTCSHLCAMEYIYFSRPDSDLEGINVHTARRLSGRVLSHVAPVEADIVIGVPDSSMSAAIGYSEESGIPYEIGLIKNKYIGRTFIQPTQELRERGVKMKLSAIRSTIKGKRLILIDDSIVRGTTSKRIVRLLKEAGAKEVHVRIASPPLRFPCFYGVDTSSRKELISAFMDRETLSQYIGADSLHFLSEQEMEKSFGTTHICKACFTGEYVTSLYEYEEELKEEVRQEYRQHPGFYMAAKQELKEV